MNRATLCAALARHIGQPITLEVAKDILREADPDLSVDPALFDPVVCGKLVFRCEPLSDLLPQIGPLHKAYCGELGKPWTIDYQALLQDCRAGTLLHFTMRLNAELVGVLGVYLGTSRAAGERYAIDEILYVRPEYRAGRNVLRFLLYAKACVHVLGCTRFRARTSHPGLARLLMRHGFIAGTTEYELIEEGA